MLAEQCAFRAGDDLAWDEYVSRCPSAGVYHRSEWARIVQRSYGHAPVYLWAREEGSVRGILPLILFRGPLGGRSLVSLPFLDEGGLCADGEDVRQALWEAALEAGKRSGAHSVELRQRSPSGLALRPLHAKVTVMLELADDPDVAWKRLGPKVRNQVRKAIGAGLEPAWCGIEGLDDFYRVFAENMRDLGSPVHARRFFATMLEEFAGSARLLLLRDGSRTVAGGVCMVFRDTALVPWASSLRGWRSKCPSNLLYWEVIRSACEKGLRWLDFGRSSPGSGTYRFKMQWGGREHALQWERFDPAERTAALVDSDEPRYRWMIRAWQHLPVPVATVIGPILRGRVSN
jgi:FemAB-related protein (PEP-CTERM system-associated)